MIRGASLERLAAIAANAEVLPSTLRSSEPHKIIEGIHAQVFHALVESGHPQAASPVMLRRSSTSKPRGAK